ncbi:MAG: chromosome segregation protein SMC [Candidatus Eisenbacteria bacterium]|nr:chromosome segregation protein SMC [Candidatus Eisenbacteria bacterium]
MDRVPQRDPRGGLMHLKRLDVFGFKSFAHKLSLEFGPGITCVVGPNGCGKTNVADAIRWVLGEQSASELRGSSMSDVIFNGTKKRRRLGMAEVTLAIDNSSGYLPTDYSEVLIGRRVFRSGESEYSINKTPCRLRDVKDLFLDTGIGTRTYSLIERKMVDSVLSDSTGHRRFMFEEASGIMKYKVRKRSALSKLKATEADMQRVSDIISEVEKQVRSLKRQLAQARRHRRYTDELRDLEIALARRDFSIWERQRKEAAEAAAAVRASLDQSGGSLRSSEDSAASLRVTLADKEEALSSLQIEVDELESKTRALADGLLVARERRSSSARRVEELNREIDELSADLETASARAQRLGSEARGVTERSEVRDAALAERSRRASETEREYRQLREQLAGRKQTRIEGLESSAGLKGELESYRARLDDLLTEHVEIERNLSDTRRELADRERTALETLEREKVLRESAARAHAEVRDAGERLEGTREALSSAREARTRYESELEAARHKRDLLTEIRDGYGGFEEGVRALLSDRSHGVDGLRGTVADILDVDPSKASAVEAALGGTAQCIVTDDTASARRAMRHLEASGLGRASFLPLDRLASLQSEPVPHDVLSAEGVIGAATDFVHVDPSLEGLPAFALEGVVIVRDLDSAIRLTSNGAGGLAFATLSGQLVTQGGILTGGRARGGEEAGLLRRAERLESAEAQVITLERALENARAREGQAARSLTEATDAARAAEEAAETADQELWETRRRLTELELARTNLAEQASQLASRRDALGARVESTRGEIDALARQLDSLSRGEDELGEQLEELERRFHSAEQERAKAAEEEKQAEIEAASARAALTAIKNEQAALEETIRNSRAAIERKTDERAGHERTVAELDGKIEEDARALDQLNAEKSAVERDRNVMRDEARAVRNRIDEIETAVREARTSRERRQQELHEHEIRETELRGRADSLRERILEEYSTDVRELGDFETPEDEPPFDAAAAREEVERLRARLRSMGPVNLLALDEYDEESKRLEFLRGQYEDLERSQASLQEAIARINRTARDMFVETFGEIRTNFITTFQRLFEGGEADLKLLEPDDPLESPIEIVASPRGKRLGRLSLLSGGERALTAIALLFAIYLVKPSPFCILDEVDAPLDDANVERFVRMLRDFSERTQFIIITHNKRTMQSADRLYGITMEESGVSKVVSVRLDADTSAQDTTREEVTLEAL